ncbi:MAG: hypothetical protein A3A81_02055 [Omnitrophica bacterium RIFCSPLOWO2_01_FULL_45_10b]|nr:MAG: hypothetical protein A3A81_02055 [Omnitrophica bacterium RIFCSPLOWO2_01_FULL_45_10b]
MSHCYSKLVEGLGKTPRWFKLVDIVDGERLEFTPYFIHLLWHTFAMKTKVKKEGKRFDAPVLEGSLFEE